MTLLHEDTTFVIINYVVSAFELTLTIDDNVIVYQNEELFMHQLCSYYCQHVTDGKPT